MAVMLLIGAGLLINSFWRLQRVDSGVNPEKILTMLTPLQGNRYNDPHQVRTFYDQLLARVKVLPGVSAVAVCNRLPADEQTGSDNIKIEGQPVTQKEDIIASDVRISPDYFRTLRIPLRRGRYFTDADSETSQQVLIINDALARLAFPNVDPIGKRINMGSETEPDWWSIVGVVGDVKYKTLAEQAEPAFYHAIAQNPSGSNFLMIKTDILDPSSLTSAVRNEVKALDADTPVTQVKTLQQHLSSDVAQPRFRTTLITVFALIALVLASIGIYGVISYTVSHRTNEIGIRMALGAQRRQVLNMIIGQGLKLAVASVTIGLAAAFALTRLMKNFLFGVSATDPVTFGAVATLLLGIALLACYIPARRATRVDPVIALRHD